MIRYAITDRFLLAPQGFAEEAERQARLLEHCLLLAREGVDFIQLREKDLPESALAQLTLNILRHLNRTSSHTRLLVNANPRIAVSIGAHGAHFSAKSSHTPAETLVLFREAQLPAPVISVSCHTVADVRRAHLLGANLILFGPVFEKSVHGEVVQPGVGLGCLTEACRAASSTPVLALGGITSQNAPDCLRAGAAGIAAIRLFQPPARP